MREQSTRVTCDGHVQALRTLIGNRT